MLLDTYLFRENPKLSPDYRRVLLLREDFENLLKLANAWLQQRSKQTTTEPKVADHSGNIYICNDQRQFITNHYHQTQNKPSLPENGSLPLDETVRPPSPAMTGSLGCFEFKQINPNSPLSFLSSRLSQFTKATRIFTTRDYTHTNVAAEFHQACDNIPNTLVIIKSGQYIAGGYTEVAWSSPPYTKSSTKAFVFSANTQKVYGSLGKGKEIWCDARDGPAFSDGDGFALKVLADYKSKDNTSRIKGGKYSAEGVVDAEKELFGNLNFTIDEYEVYKLE